MTSGAKEKAKEKKEKKEKGFGFCTKHTQASQRLMPGMSRIK
jgi:hypothetical protein